MRNEGATDMDMSAIEMTQIQAAKWENRLRRHWFLIPTGLNGALGVILGLGGLGEKCWQGIRVLGTIGLAVDGCLFGLGLAVSLVSVLMCRRLKRKLLKALAPNVGKT